MNYMLVKAFTGLGIELIRLPAMCVWYVCTLHHTSGFPYIHTYRAVELVFLKLRIIHIFIHTYRGLKQLLTSNVTPRDKRAIPFFGALRNIDVPGWFDPTYYIHIYIYFAISDTDILYVSRVHTKLTYIHTFDKVYIHTYMNTYVRFPSAKIYAQDMLLFVVSATYSCIAPLTLLAGLCYFAVCNA